MEPILDSFEEITYKDDRLAVKIIFLGFFSVINPILFSLLLGGEDAFDYIISIIIYLFVGTMATFLLHAFFMVSILIIAIALEFLRLYFLAKPLKKISRTINFLPFAILCNVGLFFSLLFLILSV